MSLRRNHALHTALVLLSSAHDCSSTTTIEGVSIAVNIVATAAYTNKCCRRINTEVSVGKERSADTSYLFILSIQSGTSQPLSLTTLAILRSEVMSDSVNSVTAVPLRPARPSVITCM
jgi:hypothetical protein